ncbi:M4 family metallopeptidase [Ornithinimicrobium cavernae]|uniref:M4 family metallopeptidase n=1 Tax=Ornithinimicrobium cavernae TaxID=2666047 RepID=UPI000D686C13|nr:M4 family metallopeptidase [Ornithinimicrobium cavernae]
MVHPRLRIALSATASLALAGSLLASPSAAEPSAQGEQHRSPIAEKVLHDPGTAAPVMTRDIDDTVRRGSAAGVAREHIAAHAELYQVDSTDLVPVPGSRSAGTDEESVRFQQTYRGVPVFGAQYVVHTAGDATARTVETVTGKVFSELAVDTTPVVGVEAARDRLWMDSTVAAMDDPTITDQGLTVVPSGRGVLAWQFEVTGTDRAGSPVRQRVLMDASVGAVLLSYNQIHAADAEGTGVTFDGEEVSLSVTATEDSRFELRDRGRAMYARTGGEIHTLDALGRPYQDYANALPEDTPIFSSDTARFDGTATSLGAVDAHVNAGKVYEFFLHELGRDGVDGEGGTMLSVVNVTSNGNEYANAFWDGTKMVYGSSDGVPFSKALDVVGHEMSHAITEHSANLLYINQSGALNEAISDYFGNAMEVDDLGMAMTHPQAGLLGEDLCAVGTVPEECAIRDLNDGRRADEDYRLLSLGHDNGGVHLNSTIASGALWDLRETLDPAVADRLVYTALTEYLTPLSDFTDMRVAVELAARAEKLSEADREAVAAAFDAHGIYAGWETAYPEDADLLLGNTVSAYEGYAGHADVAAVTSGDRWATSTLDIAGFFAGTPSYSLVVGTFAPGELRTINSEGAWDIEPAISGAELLWTRVSGEEMQVVAQRGNGLGGTRVVSTNPGESYAPSVDGTTAAWLTRLDGDTDVWVRQGGGAPVNVTPEAGTQAGQVVVDGSVVAWLDGSRVTRLDLASGERSTVRSGANIFSGTDSLAVTDDGLFWRSSGFFGDSIYYTSHGMEVPAKLSLGRVYSGQFAVNDDHFAFNTTTVWGSWGYPSGESDMHKLRIAPAGDVIAGQATFERYSCGFGAQLSPSFGDGERLVYLSTSQARTDLVTRSGPAGSC